MKNKTFLIFAAAALFVFSGCDLTGKAEIDAPAQIETVAPTASENAPAMLENEAGICANRYFPVADGYTRRYRVTSSKESDEYAYKIGFRSGADSFTETQDLKTGKTAALEIRWNCLPEGLQTASFAQITGLSNAGMKLESKKASGVALPKDSDWQIGKKWTSRYELGGTFEVKPLKGDVTGDVVLNHEIKALEENVAVPGGSFRAARVETNLSMNAVFRGMRLPAETLKTTSWYAPGVGLVKHDVKGKMGSMLMEYTGK